MNPAPLPRPWALAFAIWSAAAVVSVGSLIAQRRLFGGPAAAPHELLWAAGDWLLYGLFTPAVVWAAIRFPVRREGAGRRLALHGALALALGVSWALAGKALQAGLMLLFDPASARALSGAQDTPASTRVVLEALGWAFTTLPFGVVVYAGVVGLAYAYRYLAEARERDVQVARLGQQLAATRLAALRAHLNPHFLFNTLNTIAVRARDGDTQGTVRMVEQLSDVLRLTLRQNPSHEVTLEEELALVEQYLAIEQARFPDRLRVTYEVDESVKAAAIPSFAVQHLVENAVRHGIARAPGAGDVRVEARRAGDALEIVVRDDGAGIDPNVRPPAGRGLENTRERLDALYGGRASLTVAAGAQRGTVATLRVPYAELAMEASLVGR